MADSEIMHGRIMAIFVAPARHAGQIAVDAVQVKSGRGIVSDRFFGFRPTHKGRNLTLIEQENIAGFNRRYGQAVSLASTRRNVVTQGVRLNDLVGTHFVIGDVLCRGMELCEPCSVLARNLSVASLSQTDLIHAWTEKAGIRAWVLTDGVIKIDDHIALDVTR